MRFRVIFWSLSLFVLLYLLTLRLLTFVHIFFDHGGLAITQEEAALAHNTSISDTRPQLIPQIIHQVYHDWKNTGMPQDWEVLRQSCVENNRDWQYILWNETSSREFLRINFPWFLTTYDGYRYPVQRVDTVRYFIMRHYGGIYIDLDNGCLASLEPLLYYPSWITDGGRGALSNNIIGSMPNHPFWRLLTSSLHDYNYNVFFPYATISYASGQWFETAIWDAYHSMLPPPEKQQPERKIYRVMMDDRPGADRWVFFDQKRGGTWVNWDNRMFLWIGDHLLLIGLATCALVSTGIYKLARSYRIGSKNLRLCEKSKQGGDEEMLIGV